MLARLIWAAVAFLLLSTPANARRLALVLGQDAYPGGVSATTVGLPPLFNSRNDARTVSAMLAEHGFEVLTCGSEPNCLDLDRETLLKALDTLEAKAAGAETALVYFAGHGLASDDGNILAPIDARVDCTSGRIANGITVDRVMQAVAPARNKLMILDACRNNPIGEVCPSLAGKKLSFERIEAGAMQGLLLVTSTQFGQEALDGPRGTHSPFATALLETLGANSNIYFEQVFNEVARTTFKNAQSLRQGWVQIPGKVVGGAAPADCLSGKACIGDVRMAALEQRLEQTLMQETFDKAIAHRSMADIGQSKALEAFARTGTALDARDISGVNFKGAQAQGIRAQRATARLINLDEANLADSDLSDASIAFATLKRSQLERSRLEKTSFGFAQLSGARLVGSKAAGSYWYAAQAVGVDFSGADLRGADFSMADLRDANFSNTDLTDATFHGALLDGAHFDGAKLRNTGLGKVTLADAKFTTEQLSGACQNATRGFQSSWIKLVERWPSTASNASHGQKELISLDVPVFSRAILGVEMEPRLHAKQRLTYCVDRTHFPRGQSSNTGLDRDYQDLTFVLHLDRDLLAKSDLKSRLLTMLSDSMKSYAMLAGKTGVFDYFDSGRAAALLEFSRAASVNIKPAGDVWFSNDTVTLLNIAHNPQIADSLDWRVLARHHFSHERNAAKPMVRRQRAQPGSSWQVFFSPELSESIELSDEIVELYKQWTIARSKNLPNQFVFRENTGLGGFPLADSSYRPGATLSTALGIHRNSVISLLFSIPGHARPRHKLFVALPLQARRYGIEQNGTWPPAWTDIHLELVDVVYNDPPKVSSARDEPFSGFYMVAIPLKAEFHVKGALSRTATLAERMTGDALLRLVSGKTGELSDLQRHSVNQMRFFADGSFDTESVSTRTGGQWQIRDDRVCVTLGNSSAQCYKIYKDIEGYFLAGQKESAGGRPWLLRTVAFEPIQEPSGVVKVDDTLTIAGVRLGMPLDVAQRIAMEHLGHEAVSYTQIRKHERKPDEIFDTGFIVRKTTDATRDTIVLLTYPFNTKRTVDAIVRLKRIQTPSNSQGEIVKQLEAQYGVTSGEHRGRDRGSIDLYWGGLPANIKPGKRDERHECHPEHVGYQTMGYSSPTYNPSPHEGSLRAPGLFARDWGVPATCGPTLMSRVSSFHEGGHEVFSWLIAPGTVRDALAATKATPPETTPTAVPKIRF